MVGKKKFGGVILKSSARRNLILSSIIIAFVVAFIIWKYFFAYEKPLDVTEINDGIVITKQFSVKSETPKQNTSATGSIYVWGEKETASRMRIVASYEIDPNDFGGMTIYIPKKWYISNILSSSDNQKKSLQPFVSDSEMTLGNEWRNKVEVGVTNLHNPAGGGNGTIVIDLVSDRKAILPMETYNIAISVGSDISNGIRSIGVDSITIPISVDTESKD